MNICENLQKFEKLFKIPLKNLKLLLTSESPFDILLGRQFSGTGQKTQ